MICSLFNFCPQSAQSRRHEGALVGLAPQAKPKPLKFNLQWSFCLVLEYQARPHKRHATTLKIF